MYLQAYPKLQTYGEGNADGGVVQMVLVDMDVFLLTLPILEDVQVNLLGGEQFLKNKLSVLDTLLTNIDLFIKLLPKI